MQLHAANILSKFSGAIAIGEAWASMLRIRASAVSFKMMKRNNLVPRCNAVALLFAAAICLFVEPALAHPKLTAAVPEADAQAQSPQEIRLSFSEALVAKFSGLDLKDQNGKHVETGPAASDPKDRKQLIVAVQATLAPGRYTVEWHAVSEDTHRIKGSYSFEVKP